MITYCTAHVAGASSLSMCGVSDEVSQDCITVSTQVYSDNKDNPGFNWCSDCLSLESMYGLSAVDLENPELEFCWRCGWEGPCSWCPKQEDTV